MKYKDGTDVCEGDEVLIQRADGKHRGVVVKVLVPGTADAASWSAPSGGVLIQGAGLGLSLTVSLDDDPEVVFVRRED